MQNTKKNLGRGLSPHPRRRLRSSTSFAPLRWIGVDTRPCKILDPPLPARPFKIIEGRRFGHQSKARMDLPYVLVINSKFSNLSLSRTVSDTRRLIG